MTDWLDRCHFGDVRDVLRRMIAERDRMVLRQAELIGRRSADQVQRMELESAG